MLRHRASGVCYNVHASAFPVLRRSNPGSMGLGVGV